jgi:uncharacterized membrane protein YgcG
MSKPNMELALSMAKKYASNILKDPSTYRNWATLSRAIFEDTYCDSIGEGDNNHPSVWAQVFADGAAANQDETRHTKTVQRFAYHLILNTIDRNNRSAVEALTPPPENPNMAKQAWNCLALRHRSGLAANKLRLRRELEALRLENFRRGSKSERAALDAFLGHLNDKRLELEAAGMTIPQSDLVLHVRSILPSGYKLYSAAILAWPAELQTIERLQDFLLSVAHEVRGAPALRDDQQALHAARALIKRHDRGGRGNGRQNGGNGGNGGGRGGRGNGGNNGGGGGGGGRCAHKPWQ